MFQPSASGEIPTAPLRRTRLAGDGGAVLVEAALVTPMLVLVLFGLIEFGGAYRDSLTLSNSAGGGARQAAIEGNTTDADWYILQAVKKASTAIPKSGLVKVVIYKASGPTSGLPAGCENAGVAGSCNFYGPAELALVVEPSSWTDCTGPTANFCPTDRKVTVGTPGPDYVGIYVESVHPWVTGFFGRTITLKDSSTVRLEPRKL